MKTTFNEYIKFSDFVFEYVNIEIIFFNMSFCIKYKETFLGTTVCESIKYVVITF